MQLIMKSEKPTYIRIYPYIAPQPQTTNHKINTNTTIIIHAHVLVARTSAWRGVGRVGVVPMPVRAAACADASPSPSLACRSPGRARGMWTRPQRESAVERPEGAQPPNTNTAKGNTTRGETETETAHDSTRANPPTRQQ